MLFYSDPWKDDPYGKLQGEMTDTWCKLVFDEAKVYQDEKTYVLAGNFTEHHGVMRKYNPTEAILPGLATLVIHSEDYQVRKKDDNGKWETVTDKASIHEKLLYQHITDNPAQWLDGKNLKGSITFFPDDTYKAQDNPQLQPGSIEVTQIEPTGKLPEWQPHKGRAKSTSGWHGAGISLEDKTNFLRKELTNSIFDDSFKSLVNDATPISYLINKVVEERRQDEIFLASYFDLLKAIVS